MKMVYVLFAAVAAAAAVGATRGFAGSPAPAPTRDTEPVAAVAAEDPASSPDETAAVEGEVLEVIDVPSYTYLRIGQRGSEGTWVAVTSARLKVGDRARVRDGMKMENFASTALKRTFPVIYFGTLEGAGGEAPPAGTADPDEAMRAAHAAPVAQAVAETPVQPVERAKGPSGKTVAEVVAGRSALVGKTVRIHATVVKATPGILGRTYLHLRDGSGDAAAGTHDIVVTTEATPAVGAIVLVEGKVAVDRDVGAGYRFPVLVEDARILPAGER